MRLQVNTPPAVLAQGLDILNRALLLLPARIREGFCDRPLGKIKQVGKTDRHEVGGKTPEISDAIIEKLFHFGRDINRVASCLHRS